MQFYLSLCTPAGNTEVTRLMLQAGAKTSPTNSVGRTASQMAAFVGQHACVSIMNNFFDREQLDYYTIIRGAVLSLLEFIE